MPEPLSTSGRQTAGVVGALTFAACLGLLARPGTADVLAFYSNIGPQLAGSVPIVLDLSTAGGAQQRLEFAVSAFSTIMISFNAECSVS